MPRGRSTFVPGALRIHPARSSRAPTQVALERIAPGRQDYTELARLVVSKHQNNPAGENRPRDLIDDFLQAHTEHPELMPMHAVLAAALGQLQTSAPQVAVRSKGAKNVVRALHHHRS